MKHYFLLLSLLALSTPLCADKKDATKLFNFVTTHADALACHLQRSIPPQKPKTVRFKKKSAKAALPAKAAQPTTPAKKTPPKPAPKTGPTAEELAFKTVKEAAEGGYVPAQDLLAYCYATGTGTKANERLAFAWYLRAALEGSQSARSSLLACFDDGVGVAKDKTLTQLLHDIIPVSEETP